MTSITEEIRTFAMREGIEPLLQWSDRMQAAIEGFDVEEIDRLCQTLWKENS
jgi:hypothetical protein